MRAEVVGGESHADNQALVAENLLFIAEDRVCELRLEVGESLESRIFGRLD